MRFHVEEFSSEQLGIKFNVITGIDALNIFVQRFHDIKNIILYRIILYGKSHWILYW